MNKIIIFTLCLGMLSPAWSSVIFQDDFSDSDLDNWFFKSSATSWHVSNGALDNGGQGYNGTVEGAFIAGIVTPQHFRLEADVRVVSDKGSHGHIGFIWGVDENTGVPIIDYNATYLRTHSDHVTNFSIVNGSQSFQQIMGTPGANRDQTYHMSIEVNYLNRTMTTTFENLSQTYSGSTFDSINRNSGGMIGLISWQDHLIYDNVVLSDISNTNNLSAITDPDPIPELNSVLYLLLALGGAFWRVRITN